MGVARAVWLAIALLGAGISGAGVAPALAQTTTVALEGPLRDRSAALEITADQLSMNQSEGTAVFDGNVLAVQGSLRLAADQVRVAYETDAQGRPGRIAEVTAEGGVTLVNGPETAEAERAVYTPQSGVVVMTGNVLLAQGGNALSGARLELQLDTGTGVMEGRVKTIFQADPAQ